MKTIFSIYRNLVSRMVGPACRFHPSCSQYAEDAISKHGWRRGIILSARRLARCHPFDLGGYDPVPEK